MHQKKLPRSYGINRREMIVLRYNLIVITYLQSTPLQLCATIYFFLCLFLRSLFFLLCLAIFARLRFFPLGI